MNNIVMHQRPGLLIFNVWLALCVLGFVMVTSISLDITGTSDVLWQFSVRHIIYLAMATFALVTVWFLPLQFWYDQHRLIFVVGVLLLLVVFIPSIGLEANGSKRWIRLPSFSLQPAEIFKFVFIVYMAGLLTRKRDHIATDGKGLVHIFLLAAVPIGLILAQPDFGSVVLLVTTLLILLFVVGLPFIKWSLLVGTACGLGLLAAMTQPYRMKRLVAFMDPWAEQHDGGYQLIQSLIALGRGEWIGLGLGRSVQKMSYLPEAHTDFVFAVTGEELGFIGAASVILLFVVLTLRGFYLSARFLSTNRHFAALLLAGSAWMLGAQAFINIGVNIGLLPTKGLTLPLVSYGGNSLIISSMLVGILLCGEREYAIRSHHYAD